MPLNRSALIRISTIDRCLQNRFRRWTIDDLMEACTEALAEFEGRSNPVSRRTFQNDIALMRSDRLGYNAPIVVTERKYYMYDDPDYSITHLPLSDDDLRLLNSAMDVLRHFQSFEQLSPAVGIISKLNEHITAGAGNNAPAIDLEKNTAYKGLEFLSTLYEAIRHRKTISITYRSFKAREAADIAVYPYLLKEYRNRWFLICEKAANNSPQINIFAIDRIERVEAEPTLEFRDCANFDPVHFFDDVIGVTKTIHDKAHRVVLKVDSDQAPYVRTKPFHASQKIEQYFRDGSIQLSLKVVLNNELERAILGYGKHIEVIAPPSLRDRISRHFDAAYRKYHRNDSYQ